MSPLVRNIAVLALLVLPSVALAQEAQPVITDNKVVYGLGAGVSVPLGDADEGLERGLAVHGFARFRLTDTFLIPRVDVEYQKFDLKAVSGSSQIIAGTANLQIFLGGEQSIRPYAVGGIGAYHVKFEVDGPLGGEESGTRFGLNGGGGIAFRVNPRLSVYGEIRLVNILNDEGAVDSDLQTVPFTFGITF
jgi:opacity protein-like surface antigen